MYYFSEKGITVYVILDDRYERIDMLFPVKCRVTYKRKRRYYPSKVYVTKEDWNKLNNPKNPLREKELIKKRGLIKKEFDIIIKHIEGMLENEGFTFQGLDKRLSQGEKDSVFTAFDLKVEGLTNEGKIATAQWYRCAKVSIEKFVKSLKAKNDDVPEKVELKFSEVTPAWLKKYEKHLTDDGQEYTTISINMRALRAILNAAKASGVITQAQYPFRVNNNGKYAIPEATGQKTALNASQLIAVFSHPIPSDWEKWRDLFIFSFYCNGANLGDILRLKYEDIHDNYVEWFRGKTRDTTKKKIKIRAAITEEMRAIIDKYGNPDKEPGNYIFPYLKPGLTPTEVRTVITGVTHNINKKLKKIGKALKISNLTFYVGRHSYASISRHEGVSTFAISKSLGHKNLTTTQIYLDSLSDEEININAAKLPRWNNHNNHE